MKKLALAAVLATMAYVGWRWQHAAPVETSGRKLVFNRIWVDHMPANERDPFNVFIIPRSRPFGAFAEETRWRSQIERFRFDSDGNVIRAVFPWSGDREQFTVNARPCDEADMDFCLEIKGSKHGVGRYYSRKGWDRQGGDEEAAIRGLFQEIDGTP